jgi:hypothetical protein
MAGTIEWKLLAIYPCPNPLGGNCFSMTCVQSIRRVVRLGVAS